VTVIFPLGSSGLHPGRCAPIGLRHADAVQLPRPERPPGHDLGGPASYIRPL